LTAIRESLTPGFAAATDAVVAWGSTDRLGRWLQVVRSLLALGTFLTLVANPAAVLLHFPTGTVPDESCGGVLGLGAFCVSPFDADTTRVLLAGLCVPALIGLLPAATGPLHWVGVILFAARLQVAYVYFEAAIVKLSNPLWSDGTAMWLWVQNGGFGATPAVSSALQALLAHPATAVATTWGTIALELFLCLTIVFAPASRRRLRLTALVCGILFHLTIAVVMGLVTFGIVMTAALLVSLHRAGDPPLHRRAPEPAPRLEPDTSPLNGESR